MMKALVYTGVKEMTFRDADDPAVDAGENLINTQEKHHFILSQS